MKVEGRKQSDHRRVLGVARTRGGRKVGVPNVGDLEFVRGNTFSPGAVGQVIARVDSARSGPMQGSRPEGSKSQVGVFVSREGCRSFGHWRQTTPSPTATARPTPCPFTTKPRVSHCTGAHETNQPLHRVLMYTPKLTWSISNLRERCSLTQ